MPVQGQAAKYTINNYDHFKDLDNNGDPLAFTDGDPNLFVRSAEKSGIAPDLFDVTYYSIEAKYFNVYFDKMLNVNWFGSIKPFSDLGANNQTIRSYTVAAQIADVKAGKQEGLVVPEAYWIIRKQEHLLSNWAPKGPSDFEFPKEAFGTCARLTNANEDATVGDCIVGGRTGYSVKLVHRDYLSFAGHKLGGTTSSAAPLNNPPQNGF